MVATALAAGAPPQLLNKTVMLSWTTSGRATAADGVSKGFTNINRRTIYISNAGRPFLRMDLSGGRSARSGEKAPGQGNAKGSVRFDGGKLVGVESFASGARQWIATFDSSYASCTLAIIDAKEGNADIKRRGPDGVMYTVEGVSTGVPSCSIQAGNAFAGQ